MERIVFTNAPKPAAAAPSDCGTAIKISGRRKARKSKPKATPAQVIKLIQTLASRPVPAVVTSVALTHLPEETV
jgi:hypothetical protein